MIPVKYFTKMNKTAHHKNLSNLPVGTIFVLTSFYILLLNTLITCPSPIYIYCASHLASHAISDNVLVIILFAYYHCNWKWINYLNHPLPLLLRPTILYSLPAVLSRSGAV